MQNFKLELDIERSLAEFKVSKDRFLVSINGELNYHLVVQQMGQGSSNFRLQDYHGIDSSLYVAVFDSSNGMHPKDSGYSQGSGFQEKI